MYPVLQPYAVQVAPQPMQMEVGVAMGVAMGEPVAPAPVAMGMAIPMEMAAQAFQVGPAWCAWWLRRGWQLDWASVRALVPVATSQGGRVYYVTRNLGPSDGQGQSQAYLLPQRLERFPDFLCRFSSATGLETAHVGRISPPWTYRLLALLTALMLLAELVVGGFWLLTPLS